MQRFESRDQQFYSHVGHHMEDIRLLSLPPSYRQPDGDEQSIGNSSVTETEGDILPGVLASVEEEPSPETTPGSIELYLRGHNSTDKEQSVQSWLTAKEGPPIAEGMSTAVSPHHRVRIPQIYAQAPSDDDRVVDTVRTTRNEYLSPGSPHNNSDDEYGW